MKRHRVTTPANSWLRNLVHDTPAFRASVDEALASINIAQDLVALRVARGISQSDLARRLGVTQSAVAQLESGRARNVELRTLVRSAIALDGHLAISLRARQATVRRAAKTTE